MISKFSFAWLIKARLTNRKCCRLSAGMVNRIALIFMLLISFSSIVSSVSCTAAGATATAAGVTATAKPTVVATVVPKTTLKTTTTTTPVLIQTTVGLSLTPPQTYTEYTLPVYLTVNSTIHLVWSVSGVGEHIRMAINTPDGTLVGVQPNGGFTKLLSNDPCAQLDRSGSIVLNPSIQKWTDGYYVFHPYICDDDPGVSLKLMYWIEQ
jgi:hypothetical protein